MKVEYSSSNSGGSWWLKDRDWLALERAGWVIEWGGLYFCHSKYSSDKPPKGKPAPCDKGTECPGHRKYDSLKEVRKDRWLNAAAKNAYIASESVRAAIESWERVTGKDASDEGCNCCGPPHSFSADNEYVSGRGIAELLEDSPKMTYREALRASKRK
jgi:hypothetical protein